MTFYYCTHCQKNWPDYQSFVNHNCSSWSRNQQQQQLNPSQWPTNNPPIYAQEILKRLDRIEKRLSELGGKEMTKSKTLEEREAQIARIVERAYFRASTVFGISPQQVGDAARIGFRAAVRAIAICSWCEHPLIGDSCLQAKLAARDAKIKELNENIDHALIKAKVRIEELEHLLEAIRSQMCWEADRDQLTIGFKDLHDAMTAALGRIDE